MNTTRGSCRTAILWAILLVLGLATRSPSARAAFTIDSLTGDITTKEINSFISTMSARTMPTNNWGNAMATHGTEPEGMARMYEATKNVTILNTNIKWMDDYLVHRNDMPLGEHRVMWQGTVAPVWPNIAPGDTDSGYAGCETGMIAGYLANCARLILETPSIWNNTVPDGNPYGFGVTYKNRALTYLQQADYVNENYMRPWFINPANNRFRKPSDPRWAADAGNQSITAWNRQWLALSGFMYSAEAHDLLGDNPSYLPTYKNMVQQFGSWFVAPYPTGGAVNYTSGGHNVVKWNYEVPTDQHLENIGHAQHDIFGLYEVYRSRYTTLTSSQIQPYADTTQFVINQGNVNSWASNVDGTGSSTSLKSDFIYMADWNTPLYQMIAQSNINANQLNNDEGTKNTAYILYMKHREYLQQVATRPEVYAAENAQLTGAVVATNQWDYTGSGFVDFVHSSGDSINWTVNVNKAGLYDLKFAYALQSGDRPLELRVNGQVVKTSLSFPATGAGDNWDYITLPLASLKTGANTIQATAIGSGGAHIDYVMVSALEAEKATTFGAVAATDKPGYTGDGYMDFVNNSGDYLQWTVNLPQGGLYDLNFRYALLDGNRPLSVAINGQIVASSLAFPATGDWSNWLYDTLSAQTLVAGTNTIRVTAIGSNGANIDSLTLTSVPEPSTVVLAAFGIGLLLLFSAREGSSLARQRAAE